MLTPSLSSAQSCSGNWKCGVNYGANTIMDLYVPAKVDASPGIVVSIHYCSGNAASAHGWFQSAADKYGFIIIAPGAGGNCFDAKPERSGERENITKMVSYVVTQNHADPQRVFAAGASSGACMTQALLAAYPDVFAGGSSLAGVPAGAWTGGNSYGWTTPTDRTAAQWGDIVRNADKSFMGTRPRVQLWHGGNDTTLTDEVNWPAEVAQWTNVWGVTDANATKSQFKASQDTWDRASYKDGSGAVVVETNFASNAPHDLSGRGLWDDVVRFFGLDLDAPPAGTGGGGAGGSGGAGGGTSTGGGGAATGGTGTTTAGTATGGAGAAGAASGGNPSTGGSASSAGSPTTTAGTASSSAGAGTGTAGAPSGSTAGAGPTPGTASGASDDGGGCSVSSVGAHGGAVVGWLMAGVAVLLRRRRRP